jgi:nucleoside-diphosphate-sugar epimerase
MHLLITGGDSRFARALVPALAPEHRIILVDRAFSTPAPEAAEAYEGDLRDREFVQEVVNGVEVVLHLDTLSPYEANPSEAIDRVARGTYVLTTTAFEAGVASFVVGSSLALFDRLPHHWKINEWWKPRPTPRLEHLLPWLSELSVRECARATGLHAICLRFGHIVDAQEVENLPYHPGWLHIEDAIAGVQAALHYHSHTGRRADWRLFHITAAGPYAHVRLSNAGERGLHYHPQHDFAARGAAWYEGVQPDRRPWQEILVPTEPIPSRPIQKVVIFGSGGPVASALAQELAPHYTLRQTDLRPLADIVAENNPQSPGAPLPLLLEAPHEARVVDVRDADQVFAACEGMDAVIICTVLRHDPVDAFLVNTLGAYHIARAAVAHGIRRIVNTGPQLITLHNENDYTWDYNVVGDPPARPGRHLYGHSKYLGQEILRVYAEYHALEIPTLMYTLFTNPEVGTWFHPMIVSWQDSARALRCALELPTLPSPYEEFHITTDLPHARFSNRKAKEILGWQPQHLLENTWQE